MYIYICFAFEFQPMQEQCSICNTFIAPREINDLSWCDESVATIGWCDGWCDESVPPKAGAMEVTFITSYVDLICRQSLVQVKFTKSDVDLICVSCCFDSWCFDSLCAVCSVYAQAPGRAERCVSDSPDSKYHGGGVVAAEGCCDGSVAAATQRQILFNEHTLSAADPGRFLFCVDLLFVGLYC